MHVAFNLITHLPEQTFELCGANKLSPTCYECLIWLSFADWHNEYNGGYKLSSGEISAQKFKYYITTIIRPH